MNLSPIALLFLFPPPLPADAAQQRNDLYGDPLPPGALARLGSMRLRHEGGVRGIAFTAAGEHVVSVGRTSVRLWDIENGTGRDLFFLKPNVNSVECVAFSKDRSLLLVAWPKGAIDLLEVDSGRRRLHIDDAEYNARSIDLSCEAGLIASVGAQDGTVRLWKTADGAKAWEAKVGIAVLGISPSGKVVAAATHGGRLKILEAATGTEVKDVGVEGQLYRLAFSPDGKLLATSGNAEPQGRLWDVESGDFIRGFEPGGGILAFSPDGTILATSGWSEGVTLVDVATGKALRTLTGPTTLETEKRLAFSPSGNLLATTIGERIEIHETASGKPKQAFPGHASRIHALVFSADARTLVTSSFDDTLRQWEVGSGRPLKQEEAVTAFIVGVTGDSSTFATQGSGWGPEGFPFTLRDAASLEVRKVVTCRGRFNSPRAYAISPDGKWLAVSERDYSGGEFSVRVFDGSDGTQVHSFAVMPYGANCMAFAPGGRFLVTGAESSAKRKISSGKLWDLDTGALLLEFAPEEEFGPITRLAVSFDARMLGVVRGNGTIEVREVASGSVVYRWASLKPRAGWDLNHFRDAPVAFTRDGRRLIATGGGDTVRVWDLATGAEEEALRRPGRAFAVAADDRLLATAQETTALVWELPAPQPVAAPARETLETLLSDLGGEDPVKAHLAGWAIARAGDPAVELLKKFVLPPAPKEPRRVESLLRQLDSDDVAERDAASEELGRVETEAEGSLRAALAGKLSPEARLRVTALMKSIEPPVARSPFALRRLRTIQVLERLGTAPAKTLLDKIGTREAREALGRVEAGRR